MRFFRTGSLSPDSLDEPEWTTRNYSRIHDAPVSDVYDRVYILGRSSLAMAFLQSLVDEDMSRQKPLLVRQRKRARRSSDDEVEGEPPHKRVRVVTRAK